MTNCKRKITLGTRGSSLALCQSIVVRDALQTYFDEPIEICVLTARNDRETTSALPEMGGKTVFYEESETALLNHEIDVVVHSLKDVPIKTSPELMLAAIPERASAHDVLIGNYTFMALPNGSTIGTGSPRRQAQIRYHRPDLNVLEIHGTLGKLLKQVESSEPPEAIVLAEAGLQRLGFEHRITQRLPLNVMLPAAGQGALAVLCRTSDSELYSIINRLDHPPTRSAVTAERSLLDHLEGGCYSPVGCYAHVVDDWLQLTAGVFSLDGIYAVQGSVEGPIDEAEILGVDLAERLIKKGAADLLQASAQAST